MIKRYVVLPHKDASLSEVTRVYDRYSDAKDVAGPGEAIVVLKYEMADSELLEVVPEDGD